MHAPKAAAANENNEERAVAITSDKSSLYTNASGSNARGLVYEPCRRQSVWISSRPPALLSSSTASSKYCFCCCDLEEDGTYKSMTSVELFQGDKCQVSFEPWKVLTGFEASESGGTRGFSP